MEQAKEVKVDLLTGETHTIVGGEMIKGSLYHIGPLNTQASNQILVSICVESKGGACSGSRTWF